MNARYRPHEVSTIKRPDGTILLGSTAELGEITRCTTDWLQAWSIETPDAVFLAERSGDGWREVTYANAWDAVCTIANGLVALGLGPGTPIVIISGNSVDHGLLALAAQYIGAPVVPLAEQYALIPEARVQIDFVCDLIRPGAVFGQDADALAEVLARPVFDGLHKIAATGSGPDIHLLSDLAIKGTQAEAAHARVGPDTVAKILMTSGSTSSPKGVPTTHRMMCANQAQLAHSLPFLTEKPPVILDWLPWNHVFGGSHNFNMMLANGGALYIDEGKPAPHLIGRTIENLTLKTGTMAFNVPLGFAMIRDALRQDPDLRRRYFQDLDMLFYAGASLAQDVWDDLEQMAREVRGDMPLFTSSWGLTETAPAHLLQHEPTDRSGVIGVPMPDQEVKLIPLDDARFEVRVRGPNVFKGYLNNPGQTADAFDDEGFFRTGDAMQFVDRDDPRLGLKFDGRISEEFKLASGTWVRAASLRLTVLEALAGLASDVIIAGADRNDIGILIVPSPGLSGAADANDLDGALIVPSQRATMRTRLSAIGGSGSTKVARALVLSTPLSMAAGEVTAKGSINARRVLDLRQALVDRLYDGADAATLMIESGSA